MHIKKKNRKLFWDILRIFIPTTLLAWLASTIDWLYIAPLLQKIPWWLLVIAVITFFLSQVVIAIRWYYLLSVIDIRSSFLHLLELVFIGSFASNFLPTTIGGDAIKMVGISKLYKNQTTAVASVIADRMYNFVGMILLLPIIFILPNIRTPFFKKNTVWMITGIFPVEFREKIKERFVEIWHPIKIWFSSVKTILISIILSWLSIALAFSSFWIVTYALGISLSFLQASAIAEFSYFVALIPLAINGLGILESTETYLLTLHGATLEQAVTAALLIRLVTLLVSLIGGIRLIFGKKDLLSLSRDGTDNIK